MPKVKLGRDPELERRETARKIFTHRMIDAGVPTKKALVKQ